MAAIRAALILVLVLVVLTPATLLGQTPGPRVYEKFEPTPEYSSAFGLIQRGQVEEARALYAKIAREHPGTTLGAVALMQQARWTESDADCLPLYQAIIQQYPGSHFEIQARKNLLHIQYPPGDPGFLGAVDALAQSYGGPSLREIQARRQGLSDQVRALPYEIQLGLGGLYTSLHGEIAQGDRRLELALPVALFNRETFSALSNGDQFLHDIRYNLVLLRFGTWSAAHREEFVDPTVKLLSPKGGQSKGPRPKIRWQTTVGDFNHAQVSVEKVRMTLNGQDVTSSLVVRSKIRRSLSTKPNANFERLRFTYRPAQRLSRGTYTVAVTVPVVGYQGSGPGMTQTSWTFRIDRDKDDRYDDSSDLEEDDDSWEKEKD